MVIIWFIYLYLLFLYSFIYIYIYNFDYSIPHSCWTGGSWTGRCSPPRQTCPWRGGCGSSVGGGRTRWGRISILLKKLIQNKYCSNNTESGHLYTIILSMILTISPVSSALYSAACLLWLYAWIFFYLHFLYHLRCCYIFSAVDFLLLAIFF